MNWVTAVASLLAVAAPVITTLVARRTLTKAGLIRRALRENVDLLVQMRNEPTQELLDEASAAQVKVIEAQLEYLRHWEIKEARTFRDFSTLLVGLGFALPLGLLAYTLLRLDSIAADVVGWLVAGVVAVLLFGTIGATVSPSDKTLDRKFASKKD